MIPYDQESEIKFYLDIQNSLFTYSDFDGLVRLYFDYTYATKTITFLYFKIFNSLLILLMMFRKIKIDLDGISVISREVKFSYSSEKDSVGFLKLLQFVPQKSNYVFFFY